MHLRKAKLMFFYVRYPSSAVLKVYFPDVRFNKNNTAQLIKWFSNFRWVCLYLDLIVVVVVVVVVVVIIIIHTFLYRRKVITSDAVAEEVRSRQSLSAGRSKWSSSINILYTNGSCTCFFCESQCDITAYMGPVCSTNYCDCIAWIDSALYSPWDGVKWVSAFGVVSNATIDRSSLQEDLWPQLVGLTLEPGEFFQWLNEDSTQAYIHTYIHLNQATWPIT